MSTLVKPFIDNLNNTKERLPRIANRIILEHAEIILSILKENQLSKGFNSDGSIIGTYASITRKYAFESRKAYGYPNTDKKEGQPYDMQWSGDLFKSLNLKGDVNKEEYTIFSSNGKISFLESEFKMKLSDLTEENNDWINQNILLPNLYKEIMQDMFKGLI